ncbi:MAG: GGDEF domain-containing protein [Halopseudomonas sp.]|uniref:GGDEF domain-containing protein n=1 Tax=Halopseudomonas sp. TaxID=2901191 RepID=UPI0030024955
MSDTQPFASGYAATRGPSEQEELLRRGLVRVSIAADGIDPLLDRRLKELRGALRSDAPPHLLSGLLPDLECAVLAADQARQQRAEAVCSHLKKLIRQLQDQEPPKETLKALRTLSKQLDDVENLPLSLPRLLQDLGQLQSATLSAAPEEAASGLWSRLFGKSADASTSISISSSDSDTEAAQEMPDSAPAIAQPEASEPSPELAPEAQPPAETEQMAAPVKLGNLSGEEQNYSKVAAHIESILLNLLNDIQLLDQQETECQRLRAQIGKGLNWYELAAVLDSLSSLVLNAQQNRQVEFERYLHQLNQRLSQFQGNLEEAQSSYVESLEQGRSLEGAIRGGVEGLHEDVREAEDLNTLKANVEAKLCDLLSKVDQARELREERDTQVSERLQVMVERIQVMEVEAQTFRKHLEEQRQQAMVDSLTGLANRAGLQKRMEEEYERWQRYGGQLLLVVLDVDHFKSINDRFGHLAGDKVLRLIATQLSRRLRKTDYIGRFGGEEFVVLMPGTSLEQGATALEELRAGIEASPFHFKNEPVQVTISIGYTQFCQGDTLESVFDRADQAMYRAKDQGRNRIVQDARTAVA